MYIIIENSQRYNIDYEVKNLNSFTHRVRDLVQLVYCKLLFIERSEMKMKRFYALIVVILIFEIIRYTNLGIVYSEKSVSMVEYSFAIKKRETNLKSYILI